ncbi:hypothetical protein AGLY_003639 [Aphis glycines]|uniref:Uncharacterized protein n=1 Tax=Aphis glycines TaxID=307491 RepID=A0A6G0TZP5_APHGL|nr:hypothetical protein AGLY_003639 [Aphis glycines]
MNCYNTWPASGKRLGLQLARPRVIGCIICVFKSKYRTKQMKIIIDYLVVGLRGTRIHHYYQLSSTKEELEISILNYDDIDTLFVMYLNKLLERFDAMSTTRGSMIHFSVTLLQIAFEIDILVLYNLLLNSIEGQDKKYVSIEIALITQCADTKALLVLIKNTSVRNKLLQVYNTSFLLNLTICSKLLIFVVLKQNQFKFEAQFEGRQMKMIINYLLQIVINIYYLLNCLSTQAIPGCGTNVSREEVTYRHHGYNHFLNKVMLFTNDINLDHNDHIVITKKKRGQVGTALLYSIGHYIIYKFEFNDRTTFKKPCIQFSSFFGHPTFFYRNFKDIHLAIEKPLPKFEIEALFRQVMPYT